MFCWSSFVSCIIFWTMRTSMASTADVLPLDQTFDALASLDVAMALFDRDDRTVALPPPYQAMSHAVALACAVSSRNTPRNTPDAHRPLTAHRHPASTGYPATPTPRH